MGYAQLYGTYMNPAPCTPSLESDSSYGFSLLLTVLVEPLLAMAAATFWLVALPFVAVSLACVKVWDTLMALKSSKAAFPNPLILRRRRSPESAPALSNSSAIRAGRV